MKNWPYGTSSLLISLWQDKSDWSIVIEGWYPSFSVLQLYWGQAVLQKGQFFFLRVVPKLFLVLEVVSQQGTLPDGGLVAHTLDL